MDTDIFSVALRAGKIIFLARVSQIRLRPSEGSGLRPDKFTRITLLVA